MQSEFRFARESGLTTVQKSGWASAGLKELEPASVGLGLMRTFIPWQLVRFVWINFKMIDMIRVSHGLN